MLHLRIRISVDDPSKKLIFEVGPKDSETRNRMMEHALENIDKWQQFQGTDVLPYAPIYIQAFQGGASQPKLIVDTHFGTRYMYQSEYCVGLWYCKPVDGWGSCGSPEKLLLDSGIPHVRHNFFPESMVPVAPGTLMLLMSLLNASGVDQCLNQSHQTRFLVNIFLELELDFRDGSMSTYVPTFVCKEGKLKSVFQVVCGDRLRGEFRLTQVPKLSLFVEETYSYRVACNEGKSLRDLIWFPDDGDEMWLLPFPCAVTKFGTRLEELILSENQ